MRFQGNTRVTFGQVSGQLIWNAYVRASLWSITWSAIGDFVFCISNISFFFVGAIYVCGWHGFTCISSQHCVRFTMVECTGVPFDVPWVGMHPPRALDNAQGMFHMGSWKFSHRQFSSWDLSEDDEVWGSRKTGKRKEGLYESSRAVNLVDGLPRAPSCKSA